MVDVFLMGGVESCQSSQEWSSQASPPKRTRLEEVVVDGGGAVPPGVAEVHEEGQLEGVVERDPGSQGWFGGGG